MHSLLQEKVRVTTERCVQAPALHSTSSIVLLPTRVVAVIADTTVLPFIDLRSVVCSRIAAGYQPGAESHFSQGWPVHFKLGPP